MDRLVDIVAALRGEGGCPWDLAQDERSLRPYLLEEAYEVLHAIDRGDDRATREELGDLLFLVVLLARIAQERGAFDLSQVADGVADKMIQRHPHVFDRAHLSSGDEGSIAAWEARKSRAGDRRSVLDGVPATLPALLRAHRVSEKAAVVGFDWPDRSGVRAKVDEELAELDEALGTGDPARIGDEFGDVLFALVNLGRFLPVASEDALRGATDKFERRFRALEDAARDEGVALDTLSIEALEERWRAVKRRGL